MQDKIVVEDPLLFSFCSIRSCWINWETLKVKNREIYLSVKLRVQYKQGRTYVQHKLSVLILFNIDLKSSQSFRMYLLNESSLDDLTQ